MTVDGYGDHQYGLREGTPMITFMLTAEPGRSAEQSPPRLDHSALMTRLRFGAAAKCGPRSRTAKDDVLLVHAYEVPLLPSSGRAAAIARGVRSYKTYWTRSQRRCWAPRGCISSSSSR